MAISIVGSTYDGGSLSSKSTTVVEFSGGNWSGGTVEEGDVVVLIASCRGNISGTSSPFTINTGGYTIDTSNPIVAKDSFNTDHMVAHKLMGSTPDTEASVTFFSNSSTYEGGVMVVVLRGVYENNIIAATPTEATGSDSNVVDNASITPVATSALILVTATSVSDSSNFTYTAPPTGYTEIRQASFASGGNNSRNPLACAYKEWTSGAENPNAWTSSGTEGTCSWAGVTMAFGTTTNYTATQTDTINISEVQNSGFGVTRTDTIAISEQDTNKVGKIRNTDKNIASIENQTKNTSTFTNQTKNTSVFTNQPKS